MKNRSHLKQTNPTRFKSSKLAKTTPRAESRPTSGGLLYPKNLRAIIGQHAILEALKVHPKWVEMLWLEQTWEASQDLKKLHFEYKAKIPKIEIKQTAILDRIGGSHQGAVLFLNSQPTLDWDMLKNKTISRVILLDGIEDPHNLGAILRTSWLMDVDAILISQDRTVGLTPTAHKVASGGAEHVAVQTCHNFTNTIEELKKIGYWVFGLSHQGQATIFDLKIPEKVVWCIGAEDKGLRKTTENLCDELVRIPQASAAASYNASVASGMALVETFRQQTSNLK